MTTGNSNSDMVCTSKRLDKLRLNLQPKLTLMTAAKKMRKLICLLQRQHRFTRPTSFRWRFQIRTFRSCCQLYRSMRALRHHYTTFIPTDIQGLHTPGKGKG